MRDNHDGCPASKRRQSIPSCPYSVYGLAAPIKRPMAPAGTHVPVMAAPTALTIGSI